MRVFIMRGIPGSGKTHWATNKWKENPDTTRTVSADHFFEEREFDPSLLSEAHDECYRNFVEFCDHPDKYNADTLIVDNTNLSGWEIAPYYRYAEISGHDVTIIEVICDPHKAFDRQLHGVPQRTHANMVIRFNSQTYPDWWDTEAVEE